MTYRERFNGILAFQPVDRVHCYFFGSWIETKGRWKWNIHGLVITGCIGDNETKILEDDGERQVIRSSIYATDGTGITSV